MNLLTCIYRPTGGCILFDGDNPYYRPDKGEAEDKDKEKEKKAEKADARRVEALQTQTAVLTQDCSLFPAFPVWENIAIGDPEFALASASSSISDHALDQKDKQTALRARVREAARLGGALHFVEKLDGGFDDVLRPLWTAYGSAWPMPEGPLKDIMDRLEKWKDISGGEVQRLAACVPPSPPSLFPPSSCGV